MSGPSAQVDQLLQDYLHRTERQRRFAWVFTAIPLAVFVVLSVLVAQKGREYIRLSAESAQLNQTIQDQKSDLDKLKQTNDVQRLAIHFVQQQSPAELQKVVVYRLAVVDQVTAALKALGYSVDERVKQGNPALANKPVDTLSYGCGVRAQDVRTVAAALTNANIPIRRIVPAEVNREPNLIQVVSSSISSDTQKALSLAEISVWTRPTPLCSYAGR